MKIKLLLFLIYIEFIISSFKIKLKTLKESPVNIKKYKCTYISIYSINIFRMRTFKIFDQKVLNIKIK
jgi:hypothetical protein